jgi:CheY-like chemotaxis protein
MRPILLVEDNADDIELTKMAFARAHVTNPLVVARDGVEALDFVFGAGAHEGRDTSVQPMVVLLDLKLPKLTGLEVLKRIRADERTRNLPIVVLTTSDEERDRMAAGDLYANSYVKKPVVGPLLDSAQRAADGTVGRSSAAVVSADASRRSRISGAASPTHSPSPYARGTPPPR